MIKSIFLFIFFLNFVLRFSAFFYSNFNNYKFRSDSVELRNSQLEEIILKQIDGWACVKNCGACCKLGPLENRTDLKYYLSNQEHQVYKSMIGQDDWCIHYDKQNRQCLQYENRPDFCRMEKATYVKRFGINANDFTDICSFSCKESISNVYGDESIEMKRFDDVAHTLDPSIRFTSELLKKNQIKDT